MKLYYIDRIDKEKKEELIYGGWCVKLLYIKNFWLVSPITKFPFFSRLYGWIQKRSWTKRKIVPFIRKFQVDTSEFEKKLNEFTSFNDFFTRKLRPRALASGAILFADGRYFVYPNLANVDGIWVKGRRFSLEKLLQNPELAGKYREGSMVIARLAPPDYHRFHFPCNGTPSKSRIIVGNLDSVNPFALKKKLEILTENKRVVTEIETVDFGNILYVEVGATFVGSIIQTYTPFVAVKKGEEKGYFSFGASCIIILFEKDRIQFDEDLIHYSQMGIEVRGLFGQSMGRRK